MRLLLSILILLSFIWFAGSCKKHHCDPQPSIVGKWELRKQSGGILGGQTDYPPGNGAIYKFTSSDFESYLNGLLVNNGTYHFTKDTFQTGQILDVLVLNGQSSNEDHFIQIEENRFTFLDNFADGFNRMYERVQ